MLEMMSPLPKMHLCLRSVCPIRASLSSDPAACSCVSCQVLVMSSKKIVERRLTPTEEIYVASGQGDDDEPELTVPHYGCFGETILAGYRRQATHVAGTWVETLSLSRSDLLSVFEKNPRCAKRLVSIVLQDFRKKERLQDLSRKLLIGWAKQGSDVWAALVIQQVR